MLCSTRRTMIGPFLGHIRAMLRPCIGYFYNIFASRCMKRFNFSLESCKPNRRIPFNVKLLGPYKSHVWAILGPCFGHFYKIFSSRCQKWLKFSLETHACQIEEYHSMSNYWEHMRAMLGPCLGHIRAMF